MFAELNIWTTSVVSAHGVVFSSERLTSALNRLNESLYKGIIKTIISIFY